VNVARRPARSRDRTAPSCRCRLHRGVRAIMSAQKSTTRRRAPTYGDEQLQTLQRNTFRYFWQETNPSNGLIPDNTSADGIPASIAGVGLALSSYPVAVERSLVARAQAVERTLWRAVLAERHGKLPDSENGLLRSRRRWTKHLHHPLTRHGGRATGTLPRGGSQHAEGESGTSRLDGGGSGPEEQPDALTVWRIRCEPPFACSLLRSS
jgi:hypothetical protein